MSEIKLDVGDQEENDRSEIQALKDVARQTYERYILMKKSSDKNALQSCENNYTFCQNQLSALFGRILVDSLNGNINLRKCTNECVQHCVVQLQVGSRRPIKESVKTEHLLFLDDNQCPKAMSKEEVMETLLKTSSVHSAKVNGLQKGELYEELQKINGDNCTNEDLLPKEKKVYEFDAVVNNMKCFCGNKLSRAVLKMKLDGEDVTWTVNRHAYGKYIISHVAHHIKAGDVKKHYSKLYCIDSSFKMSDDYNLVKLHGGMVKNSMDALFKEKKFESNLNTAYVYKYDMFTIVASYFYNETNKEYLICHSTIQWVNSPKKLPSQPEMALADSQQLNKLQHSVESLERKYYHGVPNTLFDMYVPAIFNNGVWGYYKAEKLDYDKQKKVSICLHRYAGHIMTKYFKHIGDEYAEYTKKLQASNTELVTQKKPPQKPMKFFTFVKNNLKKEGKYSDEDKHYPGVFGVWLMKSGDQQAINEWKDYWDVHAKTYDFKFTFKEIDDTDNRMLKNWFQSSRTKLQAEFMPRQPVIGNKWRHLLSEAKSDKHHKPLMNEIDSLKRHINKLSLRFEAS